MKVRYTTRAASDRDRIFDFLVPRSRQAASKVLQLITKRINELGDDPLRGSKTTEPGLFTIWVAPYPYRIFYRVDAEEVVIVQIRHTSRRSL